MGVDLAAAYPEARAVFDAGREVLGRDFVSLCRDGPEAELNSTRASQPAIFLHSLAALEVLGKMWGLRERFACGFPALGAAGLSLGEYSALVFAGSLDFEEALRVVGKRGEYMQEACDAARGAMAAVVGLARERVEDVVEQARAAGLRVCVANYNSPEQTVISGEEGAVGEATKLLEAAGAKRAVRLKVAGAYHSELMAPAARKLEPLLRKLTVRPPRVPFYANVTGAEAVDPEEIRKGLLRQVESPVRWQQTMEALLARGLKEAFEVGPGQVLRGFLRSMGREVQVKPAGKVEDIVKLAAASGAGA